MKPAVEPVLQFRPHHFFCTLGYEGKGYSEAFVTRFSSLANRLRAHPSGDEVVLEVTLFSDSICEPCPNRRGARCDTHSKITALDEAHAELLGLKHGDRITWAEAKTRLRERMTVEAHHSACAPCGWKSLGVCEKALLQLKTENVGTIQPRTGQ